MKIGNSNNYWVVKGNRFDISRGAPRTAEMEVEDGDALIFDPARSALVIVDMQNFFSSPLLGRPAGALGLVPAITAAVNGSRRLGMKIVWLNWGNRPDNANLPPSLLFAFKQAEDQPGLGDELPGNLGPALVKDGWSSALTEDLERLREPEDLWIDKYRISGFYGTILDQTLRNFGINTLFYGGVNTDQCVMGTLQDGAFLGYDSVMLRDCTATTSPEYAYEGTMYNMKSMGGFITGSDQLVRAKHMERTAEELTARDSLPATR
jgi:nicotinamidase-related amidase